MDNMVSERAVGAAPTTRSARGVHRPPFWRWAKLGEEELRPLAERLNVSHNTIHLVMLPWTDPRRLTPSDDLKAAIEALTGGEVRADRDWTPPAEPGPAQQDRWAG